MRSSRRTRTPRRTTTPATRTRRSSTWSSAAARSAASCRSAARTTCRSRSRATSPTLCPRRARARRRSPRPMAFVRLLKDLLRAKDFGHRIVPIIPDEARTFGMDAYFPTAKIYNPNGQNYTSVDRELLLAYKESPQGQIIHVGINEAGAVAAFTGDRHVVLDARRAAHPGLRLLLDVRLPAHGRRPVGGGRPDGARLHHRRDRRPHDADRAKACSTRTATRSCSPRRTRRRSRTTPRTATRSRTSSARVSSACTAATTPIPTSCTT